MNNSVNTLAVPTCRGIRFAATVLSFSFFIFHLELPCSAQSRDVPFTLDDRDRIMQTQKEVASLRNEINTRFESMRNEMNTLREYAKEQSKLADILRSHGLL